MKPTFQDIAIKMQNSPAAQSIDAAKAAALGAEGMKSLVESKIELVCWKEETTLTQAQSNADAVSKIVSDVLAEIS